MNRSSRDELTALLGPYLMEQTAPGRDNFLSVREKGLCELAARRGLTLTQVMIECLDQGLWPERFRAQRGTLTAQDQVRLLKSTVAVIGAGGLGGAVILFLARTGVGRLVVCDGDSFDESNLNRQLLADAHRLGRNKALCAAEEIKSVNPAVEVVTFPVWAAEDNLMEILGPAQVAVDCLDTMETRYMLEEAACRREIPFVHGAVAGLEGMLMTVYPKDPGLRGLYGPVPAEKKDSAETLLGVPAVTPALVAGLQATEVVNILLGRKPTARGRLLHLDLSIPAIEINELG